MPNGYILKAFVKLIFVIVIFLGITLGFTYAYFYMAKGRFPRIGEVASKYNGGSDILILPYNSKSYSGYGAVFEPEITLKVKNKDSSYEDISFLLDSGAVVSTLPFDYTKTLGKDITNSKRIVLRGFGDKRTFGYMSTLDLKIKDKKFEVPVVFSEGETSKRIIGRNGFFDVFTVVFDHNDRVIRIAE
ncbi:hypothetical protein GW755_00080 [bacterium]|nr:hypothetical protein [bacterium]